MSLLEEIDRRRIVFNEKLEKFLENGEPEVLYSAVRHLPLAGGKRLRPVLSMISCEAVNGDVQDVIPVSIAIELIHNFTLVHDDIMDKSRLRRNRPTVHVEYGEPTAVLAGDLLFTKAFESLHLAPSWSNIDIVEHELIKTVIEICEGQYLDTDFEKRENVTEMEYFEMIKKKTAVLFQFSSMAGGIMGGGEPEEVKALREYGKYLGLAFQIHDDYLDVSSDEKNLGKDIGNDIRNGKKTLIAVHCLNNASDEDYAVLREIFGNKDASLRDVKRVYDIFVRNKSVEYARNKALEFHEAAKKQLEVLNDSEAKRVLEDLAVFSIERSK